MRKPKPAAVPRKPFPVLLRDAEKVVIQRAAKKEGVESMSRWAREKLLQAARKAVAK